MKRKMQYILMTLMLITVTVSPASASAQRQPLAVPDQLAYIDAQLTVFWAHLATFESGYLAANGMYFQSLDSHSTPPSTITPPDGLNDYPSYENVPLAALWDAAALPFELGWSFSVNTYDGPNGLGYVLNVSTVIDGDTYMRSINYGPETYRDQQWFKYIPVEF